MKGTDKIVKTATAMQSVPLIVGPMLALVLADLTSFVAFCAYATPVAFALCLVAATAARRARKQRC